MSASFTAPLSRERFIALVEAGIQAPSADNRHTVLFDRSGDTLRIWSDAKFQSAPFHRRVLGLLALGAVVENIAVRARSLGLTPQVMWQLAPQSSDPLAEVAFSTQPPMDDDLASVIPARHTNRSFFHGPGLTSIEQARLEEDAEGIDGAKLVWLDEPKSRHAALGLIRLAEAERFRSRQLHEELFSSVRFDAGWKNSTEEGIAPGSLAIEAPLRRAFSALGNWRLMRWLARLGAHHLLGLRAGDAPCRFSPHLAVLVTTLQLEPGALAVGQALERLWLRATSLGLALQPLAASALYALEDYHDIRRELRDRLRRGWSELAPGSRPLVVFRLGRASAPMVRSGRRPVLSYVRPTAAI